MIQHMIWIFLIKHREGQGQLQERGCPDFSIAPSIPFCLAHMKSTIGRTPCPRPLSVSKLLTCSFLCKYGCDVFTSSR